MTNKVKDDCEVAIIGGGVIGCFIAYYLCKQGKDVVLIEQKEIGSGASGANDACIMSQSKKPGPKLSQAIESCEMWKTMSDELDYNIEYTRHGSMIISETEDQMREMGKFSQAQIDAGLPVEFLDYDELHERQPSLSSHILSASYCPLDGEVNPFYLLKALVRKIEKHGGRILTHTKVKGFRKKNDRITEIETDKGDIKPSIIISATGAYSGKIGRLLGCEIPIFPRRGQILITEIIPRLIDSYVMSAKAIVAKHKPVVLDKNGLSNDYGQGMIISQTVKGNMVLGVTHEFVGFDTKTTIHGMTSIAEYTSKIIPSLKKIKVIRAFAGLRPYCANGPIIGPVNNISNFILVAGHEGDGVALAPVVGKTVSDNILSKKWS